MEALAEFVRSRPVRLGVLGMLAAVPLMSACGTDDTAGPERGVAVGEVQQEQYFFEGKHLGHTVTVSAMVSEVHGSRTFKLSGGDFGDNTLLVMAGGPVEVERGRVVRVTGTVGQLHFSASADKVPYVQRGLYAESRTEAYLYDATVEPLPTP